MITANSRPIHVKVNAVSMLGDLIGGSTCIVLDRGGTVGDLINKLDEEYGTAYSKNMAENLKDSIMKRFNLLVNGKVIRPQDIDRTLNDGDEILFFHFAAGG